MSGTPDVAGERKGTLGGSEGFDDADASLSRVRKGSITENKTQESYIFL